LGVSISLGDQALHWREFLQSLVERGLKDVKLIISDTHVGLQAARKAVFSGVP
jgi:transposase-like protein